MRFRLPNDFFKIVKGEDFYSDFFGEDGKVELESAIETVYNNNTILTSIGKIDIIKKGFSDGYMRFRYTDNIVRFYGLQETKRDVKPTITQFTKQLIQAFGYYGKLSPSLQRFCKVFCLNSAYFYGYILVEDIKDLLDSVLPAINSSGISASKLYSKMPEISSCIKSYLEDHKDLLHYKNLPNNFELNQIFREIYLNCL